MKKLIYLFLTVLIVACSSDDCGNNEDESYCKEMNVIRLIDTDNETVTFEISTDQWHYLAITKSNDLTGKVYLDGNLVGEGTFLDVNYNWSQLFLGVSYFTSWRKLFYFLA
ncbi:LamG domain-containing protein [Saprospiraceae bacterium]|nr:LamG domain-containing protein [Saprospiraceae bacterium]